MFGKLRGQGGMSLVEATIILLVLALLTGVIAPSITEFVDDAKRVKVKEDCEALGLLTAMWSNAVGGCLQLSYSKTASSGCTKANRVDILFSDGPDIVNSDTVGEADVNFQPGTSRADAQAAALTWDHEELVGDSFEDQFVLNEPVYKNDFILRSPKYVKPWPPNPPQIQAPVSPDPWGHKYVINSMFLQTAVDADAGTGEGLQSGVWLRKVFCLSPGQNGLYETNFSGDSTDVNTFPPTKPCRLDRQGDDYVYPIGCM